MKKFSPASAYQQSSARGASPVGLIVSLYDTVLRDFRRALAALDSGSVETRIFELNHALTVIAHLKGVLDHRRGGEAAARLNRFYEVTHGMILEVNVSGSRAPLLKLIDLYSALRQAWQQAEKLLPSDPATKGPGAPAVALPSEASPRNPAGALSAPSASAQAAEPEGERGRWSA